jgi:hypothetical protein
MISKTRETILNLKWLPNDDGELVLHEYVSIFNEETKETCEIWRAVSGAPVEKKETRFSERFKYDTFKPHNIKDIKTTAIDKKLKLDIDFDKELGTVDNIKFHVERSIRLNNLMSKLLKDPVILKKEGFNFKGNLELKKAITLLCREMGGEWGDAPNYFI